MEDEFTYCHREDCSSYHEECGTWCNDTSHCYRHFFSVYVENHIRKVKEVVGGIFWVHCVKKARERRAKIEKKRNVMNVLVKSAMYQALNMAYLPIWKGDYSV